MELSGRPGRGLIFFLSLRYSVLGSIEVDGSPIGSPLERRLLAALLVARGSVVSVDRLLDILWGDNIPKSANNTLQSKVSRLRRLLGAQALKRVGGGYSLTVTPGSCDADRFEDLARAADGLPPAQRVAVLDDALSEWRGPAFEEFADEDFARTTAIGLEQRRLAVCDQRLESLLTLDESEKALASVDALIEQDPFRESFWSVKMRALAASGRSVEALRVYAEARTSFVEETGLEPSSVLTAVEQQILADSAGSGADPAAPALVASIEGNKRWPQATDSSRAGPPETEPVVSQVGRSLPDRPFRVDVKPAPLIGRIPARRSIEAALTVALRGQPRLIAVVGDTGTGKSQLMDVAASSVRADGVRVLTGRCLAGPGVPLGPIGQLASSLDVARSASPMSSGDFYDPLTAPGSVAVTSAVLRLLDRLLERPTVLVLDDMHHADEATTAALELLVSEMVSRSAIEPVPLAVMVGHGPLTTDRPAHGAMARLGRQPEAVTIELTPLDTAGVAAMIEATSGVRPDGLTADRFHQTTGGVPLFIKTQLERWMRDGHLTLRAGCLHADDRAAAVSPVDIELLWEQRWSDAPVETTPVLEALSLCPVTETMPLSASVGVLAGVLDIDGPEVVQRLDQAADLGLLVGNAGMTVPPQLAALISRNLGNAARARLLERLCTELIEVPHFDGDATAAERYPSLAADTAIRARDCGASISVEEVVLWSRRAGEQSLNLGAWPAAVHYLEIVAAHTNDSEAVLADGSPLDLALGLAAFRAHDEVRAQDVLVAAADRADRAGQTDLAGSALSVICRIAFAFDGSSELPVDSARAVDLMERFIAHHNHDCPRQAALGAALLAEQAAMGDDLERAGGLVEHARAICSRAEDDDAVVPEVEFGGGLVALGELRLREAEECFATSSSLAFNRGDRWVASWGAGRRILARVLADDQQGAERAVSQALDLQVPLRLWSELAMTRALQASLAAAVGDDDEARRFLEESDALSVRSGYAAAGIFAAPVRALVSARSGEAAMAREALRPLDNSAGRPPWSYAALVELALGNLDAARELVAPQVSRVPTAPTLARLPAVAAVAATGAATGESVLTEAAEPAIDWLHERGVRRVPGWPVPFSELVG
jgi:DNA-binding SARP family transcriptional activator